MRFALLFPIALSLALAPAVQAKEPPPPEVTKDINAPYPEGFRVRVTAAVDRGVEFLMKQQAVDGSWNPTKEMLEHRLGQTALATLACLKGGLTNRDPGILKAVAWMRTQPLTKTYDVAVLLMALHALYSPTDERQIVEVDKYGQRKIKDPCLTDMPKQDRDWMRKGVAFLLEHQEGGHWRYPENGQDLSNTQYALLGLWAASRCGMKIPSQVWMDALAWLLASQEPTGRSVDLLVNEVRGKYVMSWSEKARARGFRYIPKAAAVAGLKPVTGSMTTAGMAGVAICQDELWPSRKFTPAMRKRSRRAIRDAMAWLQDNFDVARNPGEPEGAWHYYYLYGLERAGILSRSRFMGKYDWYKQGADFLLERQRSDGSWLREGDVFIDTAFAVLFLKRSTTRLRNPAITHSAK
jgi:hypothetical protein